jgi:hypothetical protein
MWDAWVNEKCVSNFSLKFARGQLTQVGTDGGGDNIKWVSEKYGVKIWTGFGSLRIESDGEL